MARVLRFRATLPGGLGWTRRNSERAMQVQVKTYVDEGCAERLRRFSLGSRVIEVADNIDQRHGVDYRYVKVSDRDGNVYILRHNETRELTMYQRTQSQAVPLMPSAGLFVGHSPRLLT